MVKNWADHCDSDDEEEEVIQQQEVSNDVVAAVEEEVPAPTTSDRPPAASRIRNYEYPTAPPFQAFVGNLSFSIEKDEDLIAGISHLVSSLLEASITILNVRIMKQRSDAPSPSNNPHRGFAYVEVASLEDLKVLMQLNEKDDALLAGRLIQLDTAGQQQHRKNGGRAEAVDGSKFRGGRYAGGNSRPASSTAEPTAQRRSLNLKPRTKPIESTEKFNNSASNIFGQARPRDEASWQERRKSEPETKAVERNHGPARGRGGRGKGEAGRDHGEHGAGNGEYVKRNKGGNHHKNSGGPKKPETVTAATETKVMVVPPTSKATEGLEKKPVTKAPSNAFAALALDESDSD